MEPIKVQITLDLSERALSAIEGLAAAISAPAVAATPASTPRRRATKPVETKEAPAAPEAQAAQPTPEPEAAAAAPAPAVEDLPITDDELRQIVKEARDRTSFPAVRGLFNEFGIKASIECPMERRAELVDRLNKLVA